MKIDSLTIKNFRGIVEARMEGLGDTVIIAGPNGSGKSCIFDAIRFLKSIYGGYQQNEIQTFFSEFQINAGRLSSDIKKLFNDLSKPLHISIRFSLSDEEKSYIQDNAHELLSDVVWKSIFPEAFNYGFYTASRYSAQIRERQPEVDARVAKDMPDFLKELNSSLLVGEITAMPSGQVNYNLSKALSVLFNSYRPPNIGVIDYHGPLRLYGRENVQSVTLDLNRNHQQRSQSSLYNYSNKYGNVKAEMAAAFVQDLLARDADPEVNQASLASTLQELFEHFFPHKEFVGPKSTKDGKLTFPVKVGESTHDLDELSSGEKEVLYGYLRMRNSAPRHSIVLLDEPELHLNPALIRGLPDFYRRHLSLALNNQLWLVSHSDALLREVVGQSGYHVYHMVPANSLGPKDNQVQKLEEGQKVDLALVDLVGDVAAYRPGGKTLILEGGGDSDFDRRFVTTLFGDETASMNVISGSNKVRVQALVEVLEKSQEKGHFDARFFAVTDKDLGGDAVASRIKNHFIWDVYHIENYLLEGEFIADVWRSLGHQNTPTADQVIDDLRDAARDTEPKIVRQRMMDEANSLLIGTLSVKFDPAAGDFSQALRSAVEASKQRLNDMVESELSTEMIDDIHEKVTTDVANSFGSGAWKKDFPGRDVLKRYLSVQNSPIAYEQFRNLIMSKMADADYRPKGMSEVIEKIVQA